MQLSVVHHCPSLTWRSVKSTNVRSDFGDSTLCKLCIVALYRHFLFVWISFHENLVVPKYYLHFFFNILLFDLLIPEGKICLTEVYNDLLYHT